MMRCDIANSITCVTLYKLQQKLRTRNAELQAALERELTGILGYCQILLKKLPRKKIVQDFLDKFRIHVQKICSDAK